MLANKILKLIDKSLDSLQHWGCDFNCVKQHCNCDNKVPVSSCVCVRNYFHKSPYNCKYISNKSTIILV